jgi:FkbM family methyltransferase
MIDNPEFLNSIRINSFNHKRGTDWFNQTEINSMTDIIKQHGNSGVLTLGELGELKFPYFKMGNIDSSKLFGLDELILFSFYYTNRNRYKKTLDLGANIGLHTLVMKKLGFQVTSYEPDSVHLSQIETVMKLNDLSTDGLTPKAISDKRGTMEYIRILGNTTGSHLLGSKNDVYGETEVINVEVDDILEVLGQGNFDLVKMDVEGHEAILLKRITTQSILKTDIMLEIGSEANAKEIFTILADKKISAYAQKINWERVEKLEDLPSHHTHGSLFLSMQGAPNWSTE